MKNAKSKFQQKSKENANPVIEKTGIENAEDVELLEVESLEEEMIPSDGIEPYVLDYDEPERLEEDDIDSKEVPQLAEAKEMTEPEIAPEAKEMTEPEIAPETTPESEEAENTPEDTPESLNGAETTSKVILIKSGTSSVEISNKQKIKALKRAIENKTFALDREKIKVRDWRVQAADRDQKATDEYKKRKAELEEMMQKNQSRFDNRMARTKKWWWEYCINHEQTKIKKIEEDMAVIHQELAKIETPEPAEATK